ncbi:MAG: glycine cleavage T C-terminal barrel domain-containing protein [Rhizomicrobium sp.]
MSTELLRATPFHMRAAEANRLNRWENRGGFTLAASYADPRAEALAGRFGAILADISWHWRIAIVGERADEFVSRLFTRDVSKLVPGTACDTLWLNDGGGVRGIGWLVRTGRDSFLLISEAGDMHWMSQAASLYGVAIRDVTAEQGVLKLVGPYAGKILETAGLSADLAPHALRKYFWKGLEVALSRLGGGYEVWCTPDDALIVWDRLFEAGASFALCPAGQSAMDIFAVESGILRVRHDFEPARDGFSPEPSVRSLGLLDHVEQDHDFNGRAGFLAAGADKILVGVLLESDIPAPRRPLTRNGRCVGRTLSSLFSPALGRAIALAVLETDASAPGTVLQMAGSTGQAAALPFLPIPVPMLVGDGKSAI